MKSGIFKSAALVIVLIAPFALSSTESEDGLKDAIHYSQETDIAAKNLKKIAKIAAYDNKKSDVKKAIQVAEEIRASPDFSNYSHIDRALFFGHLGWLYGQEKNFSQAIEYYQLALQNRTPFDQSTYRFSINQLLVASVEGDKVDEVYDSLAKNHFPNLWFNELLTFAEFYSQNLRFDLAEKLFLIADEISKNYDDYDRHLYFATYIKHASLHKRQDILNRIADQYAGEGKTIKWSQLVAWKNKSTDNGLPIIKVPPLYPNRALHHKVNGYTVAEYTVDKQGKPKDIVIVREYPEGYFREASVKATKKFVYRPFIGPDGNPVEKHNIKNRFTYLMIK